jgi:hypothetical protein
MRSYGRPFLGQYDEWAMRPSFDAHVLPSNRAARYDSVSAQPSSREGRTTVAVGA